MISLYGNFRTRTFTEIFPSIDDFRSELISSGLYDSRFTDSSISSLYYLLYASYGNSHIASSDENQFKYKLYSIIFNKGNAWQKSLEIQRKLQDLTEEEILQSARQLTSHAYNPGEGGERVDSGEYILDYINDQSATKMQGAIVEKYFAYLDSLRDVTTSFIQEFKVLFLTVVNPEIPLWYEEEVDE